MFVWRKRQIADSVDKDIDETALSEPTVTPTIPEVVAPRISALDSNDAEYTVGINYSGNTQLRIRLDYGSATLTMTPVAVRKLIRQLEATLEDEPND